MTDRLEVKAALSVTETGEISGLAWPFGSADRVGDQIEKGAIVSTSSVPMLWAHDHAQVVGIWEQIEETAEGLIVKGRLLVNEVERAREVHAMVKAGAVTGLSIGFVTKKAQPQGRGRRITALELHEVSIVAVPMHPGAKITSVKSVTSGVPEMDNEETQVPANVPQIDTKAFNDMKSRLDAIEAKGNRPGVIAQKSPLMSGDEVKSFNLEIKRQMLDQKALTISAPGTGENLVTDTFLAKILEKIGKTNPIRQLASKVQLDTGLLKIPRLVTGIAPGSVTETGTKPESTPTFEQISIEPYAMGAQVLVSRSQLEDSALNLVSWLTDHMANRFGELESSWFVNGNGTTQAEGILTSDEVQEIEAAAATIAVDDLLDLLYSVKASYQHNGSWIFNRKTARLIRGLKDADGNLIWERSIQNGEPSLILGQPVYIADDMPDPVAGATPIVFGDVNRGYLITDRIAFEPSVDYSKFSESDLVQFVGRRRVGGKVIMGEAMTKLKLKAA